MHWTKVIGIGPNQVGGYSYTSSPRDVKDKYVVMLVPNCHYVHYKEARQRVSKDPACFEIVWLVIFTHSLPVVDYAAACRVRVLENRG